MGEVDPRHVPARPLRWNLLSNAFSGRGNRGEESHAAKPSKKRLLRICSAKEYWIVDIPKIKATILFSLLIQVAEAQQNTGTGQLVGFIGDTPRIWSPGVQYFTHGASFVGAIEYGYRTDYTEVSKAYYSSNSVRVGIDYQVRDGVMWLPNYEASVELNGLRGDLGVAVFRLNDIPDQSYQKVIISPWAMYGIDLIPSPVSLFLLSSDGSIRPDSFTSWGSAIELVTLGDAGVGWYEPIPNGAGYFGDVFVDITSDLRTARSNGWQYVAIGMQTSGGGGVALRSPQIVSANFNITANSIPESSKSPVYVLIAALTATFLRAGSFRKPCLPPA